MAYLGLVFGSDLFTQMLWSHHVSVLTDSILAQRESSLGKEFLFIRHEF